MEYRITRQYLWLPVTKGGEKRIISLWANSEKIQEFVIETGERTDFFAYLFVGGYLENTILLEGGTEEWAKKVINADEKPENKHGPTPYFHFTPDTGWMNDPNGLIYLNGVWHMSFQHNPYGITWNNIHWGHAVSKDLFRWEQQDPLMIPDKNGVAFSGCAIEDKANHSGMGKGTVFYFYTAATNTDVWPSGEPYTQRIRYSTDGGRTLAHKEAGFLPHISGDNRDPKVFFYKQGGRYVMVLYLEDADFAILNSENLLDWQLCSRVTLPGAWECPDLLRFEKEDGTERWIFWTADGYYYFGEFDGKEFVTDGVCHQAYGTKLPYAAQTYSGTEGRIVLQSWLRVPNQGGCYTGIMAIPAVMTLTKTAEGERICLWPVEEIKSLRKNRREYTPGILGEEFRVLELNGGLEIEARLRSIGGGIVTLEIYGQRLTVDFNEYKLRMGKEEVGFPAAAELDLRIFVDACIIEIFVNSGIVYFPYWWETKELNGDLILSRQERIDIRELIIFGY